MRTSLFATALFAMAMLASPDRSGAQTSMGLNIRNGKVENFYMAIGDYYRVPEREVTVIHERGIAEDEVPVVYFIARHSRYAPSDIVQMRLRGESWWDISDRCGVSRDDYYIDESGVSGPPFGHAYGYWKKHRRGRFSDNDIVTSVNVHWMKDRYGWSAPEVIRYRSNGESWASIHEKFRARGDNEGEDHGHGNGRGNGRGHGNGKHKGWK